jgi:hypothetical protein
MLPRLTADKCAAGLTLLFAAGAITFFANAQGIQMNKEENQFML